MEHVSAIKKKHQTTSRPSISTWHDVRSDDVKVFPLRVFSFACSNASVIAEVIDKSLLLRILFYFSSVKRM